MSNKMTSWGNKIQLEVQYNLQILSKDTSSPLHSHTPQFYTLNKYMFTIIMAMQQ